MGQKGAKLTQEDISLCKDVSGKASSGVVDEANVKKLMAKYKASRSKTGGGDALKSPAELQQALESLDYFKNQTKALKKLIKPAIPPGTPSEVVTAAHEILDLLFLSPEGKEEQSKTLFSGFDKDKDGTVDLREFLSGFLLASSNDPVEGAKMTFDAYDLDGSGTLSKEEVANLLISTEKSSQKIAKVVVTGIFTGQLMTSICKHGDKGTQIALRVLKKHIGGLLDEAFEKIEKIIEDHATDTTEKLFEQADTDKNGTLSKDEYVKYSTTPEMQKAVKEYNDALQKEVWDKIKADLPEKVPGWIEEIKKEMA